MRSPRRLSRRADVTRHPSLGGLPRPCAIARLTHDSALGSLPPLPNRCRTPDTADTHRRRRSRDCRYADLRPAGRRLPHAVVEPRWRSPDAAGKRRLRPGHSRRGAADISGFELCKRLCRFSEVPVIFLTARSEEIDRVVGLEIGADDYVVKPFSPRAPAPRGEGLSRDGHWARVGWVAQRASHHL